MGSRTSRKKRDRNGGKAPVTSNLDYLSGDGKISKDMWINARSNLRGPDGNRAWDNQGNIGPESGARFLELADIALGHKKPAPQKTKAATVGAHQTEKDEPYST